MTSRTKPVSRETLDEAYSPSLLVPEYAQILEAQRVASENARSTLPCQLDVPYSSLPGASLDWFPPPRDGSGAVLAFVHGGHWQELSSTVSCFLAPGLSEIGVGFAAIGYPLAPYARLRTIVACVQDAIRLLVDAVGGDHQRLHIAGSSAGAHLVAAAQSGVNSPTPPVAGAYLLSGVFDLARVQRSYVNRVVRISEREREDLSPARHPAPIASRIVLATAEVDPDEYVRQRRLYGRALAGVADMVDEMTVPRSNHFDLPTHIVNPSSILGQTVRRNLGVES